MYGYISAHAAKIPEMDHLCPEHADPLPLIFRTCPISAGIFELPGKSKIPRFLRV
jgi:hypothetical protein